MFSNIYLYKNSYYFTSESEVETSAISKVKNANKVQIVINKK